VLALMAPNMPEYAVVFHAVAMAGGIITTINSAYTETEVHHQLHDFGARILVTIPPLAATAARAGEGTQVAEIYVLGEAQGARPLAGLSCQPGDGYVTAACAACPPSQVGHPVSVDRLRRLLNVEVDLERA
jgi:hypothetical protein